MEIKKVFGFYFSPTHSTKKITEKVVEGTGKELENIDMTFSWKELKEYSFDKNDLVIFGSPVYSGKTPKFLRESMRKFRGNETPIVVIGVYGNRAYEDFFVEAQDIFEENGFKVIGAGAFLGAHSYTIKVAEGRPTSEDLEKAFSFGKDIISKLEKINILESISLPGNRPYKDDGVSRNVAPEPTEDCKNCGACVKVCPTGAIKTPGEVDPTKCILCHACVRFCKFGARKVKGDAIKPFINFLEGKCMDRKEIEIFL